MLSAWAISGTRIGWRETWELIDVNRHEDRLWVGSMPEAYDRLLAPAVFEPFARDLAERAAAHGPARVLELAAGTGVLTKELVRALPEAEVAATDLNEAMVSYGRRQVPGAMWQPADAQHLPFDDAQFDLVVCQFGVMFFPDRPAAFREARRILTPGGAFLFSTWDTVDAHGFAAALTAGIQDAFPDDPPTFIVDVPHGYADVGAVTADLSAGGLEVVSADSITLDGRSSSAADVAMGFCTGTPLRAGIEKRGDLAANTAVISKTMTSLLGEGPVTCKMTAYVVEARPHR
jgi:SAM-dependent methyltransferase